VFVTKRLPLLADDLGNVGIVESGIASDDGLLVVLPIQDKCCSGDQLLFMASWNKESVSLLGFR